MSSSKISKLVYWLLAGVLLISISLGSQPNAVKAADAQPPGVTIQKIVAAYHQTFALDTEGRLWGWGAYDPLIGGLKTPKSIDFFKDKKIKDIAAGSDYVIVLLADGTVWTRTEGGSSKALFEQVPGLSKIQSIGTAPYYANAVGADGKVWVWNHYGPSHYRFEKPVARNDLQDVVQLSGYYAVKKDGTVWFLGLGGEEPAIPIEGLTDVRKIAVGNLDQTVYALKKDGTVWGWGSGMGSSFFDIVQVQGLEHFVDLAGGGHHFVGLKDDGTVWTWGQNNAGQLGDGTTQNSATPVQVKGLSGANKIFSGFQADHSFAILKDGTVWAWGGNSKGETGTNAEEATVKTPKKVMFAPVAGNAGGKFTITYHGQEGNEIDSAAGNDKGTIVAATSQGLLLSTDYGEKWTKLPLPAEDRFYTVKHAKDYFYFYTYNTNKPKAFWSKDGRVWTPFSVEGAQGPLTVRNIVLLNNQYVMLASYDSEETHVFTSSDGISWQEKSVIPADDVYLVTWNGKRYTAIGGGYRYFGPANQRNQFILDSGSKQAAELIVCTSDDLKDWTMQSGSVKPSLRYTFVVNGVPVQNYDIGLMEESSNGTIKLYDTWGNVLTSKDGITFTLKPEPAFKKIDSRTQVLSNGKQYLIYASLWRDEGVVFTSKDKVSWKAVKIPNIPLGMNVLKSGNKFIGFGKGGLIASSNDGLKWNIKRSALPAQYLEQVIRVNGRYFAVGGEFQSSVPAILSSKDGNVWSRIYQSDRYDTETDAIRSIASNGKRIVAVGGSLSYISADGAKWQKHTVKGGAKLRKVVWTGKVFVALGATLNIDRAKNKYTLYSSADGINWKPLLTTTNPITDIAANGGTVVAVGTKNNKALAMSSKDLKTWREKSFALGKNNPSWKGSMKSASFDYDASVTFENVQWVNNQFVIMSDLIYTSKDGVNWSAVTGSYDEYLQKTPSAKSYGKLIWTGKDYRYYKNNILGISKNLKNWDFYEIDRMYGIKNMIWTGTDLLGVGDDGLIIRIKDKK
jgi:hypothetical protein